MAEGARVESVEVMRGLKVALLKFQEAASTALGDAESEMGRMMMWLTTEQDSHWRHQIRKREEIVMRCKEAVRMKKIFKDATGRQQSAIEEEKALKLAMRNLEEAQQKLAAVRKWARVLPKEIELYKGSVQRFATTVQSEIPVAAGHLEKLASKLDAYVSLRVAEPAGASGDGATAGDAGPSMGRGGAAMAGLPADELARLLAQVPPPATRAESPSWVTEPNLPIPTVPPEQQAPAMLPVTERRKLLDDAMVFVARAFPPGARLFLHRHPKPASKADTGWSVAPADVGPEPEFDAIRAADLLRGRPDLADLLGLPYGFSVIIDSAGISEVLDAKQQPAWRRA